MGHGKKLPLGKKTSPRRQCKRGRAVLQPRIYEDNPSDYGVAPRHEREIFEGTLNPDRGKN
jgi:hypothetical protein